MSFSSRRVAPAISIGSQLALVISTAESALDAKDSKKSKAKFHSSFLQLSISRTLHSKTFAMADRLVSTMPHSRTERLPRSPTSLSSSSSRRVSLRSSVQSEKLHSPPSPPARLNQKRAASLEIIEGNPSAISELSISSPKSDPANSASHVCLCQPDLKIPRPRNGMCQTFVRISHTLLAFPSPFVADASCGI